MSQALQTLLIVDDDPGIHAALRLTLRREPYTLLNAYDAEEALLMIEQDPLIRGVLCDQNMPGTSGLDLLIALRLRRPDLPTMVLTGEASVDLATRAVNEAGVRGFLPKPWTASELRALLRQMLAPTVPRVVLEPLASEARGKTLQPEPASTRKQRTGAILVDESNS